MPRKPNWVSNYVKVAEAIGVTRKTLDSWRRKYPDAPRPRDNGEHSISAWREFVKKHGLKGAEESEDETLPSWEEVRIRRGLLEIREKEINLAEKEGLLVDPTEMLRAFDLAIAAVNTAAESYKSRIGPKLIGLRDIYDVDAVLDDEMQFLFMALNQFRLKDPTEEVQEDEG